jgi:hypothetical protein
MESNPEIEVKHYTWHEGHSEMGRSTIVITCPFCGQEIEAYKWSLAGCGKKCFCGAKHTWFGYFSTRKI